MFRHASISHEFLSRVASSAHSQNLFAIRWGSTLMRCCYSQTLHGLGWSFAVYIVLCSCAQLIDTFPTLCDLMGLPQPTTDAFALEGVSLRPLLERPSLKVLPSRDFALSTYARCPQAGEVVPTPTGPRTTWNTECIHDTERTAFKYMGYTIRAYSDDSPLNLPLLQILRELHVSRYR